MTDRPPLDPRFDARFQRGYSAPAWERPPQERLGQQEEPGRVVDDVGMPPATSAAPAPPAPVTSAPAPGAPAPAAPAPTEEPAPVEVDLDPNPWSRALTVTSSILLALGVLLLVSAVADSGTNSVNAPQFRTIVLGQLRYLFAPVLVTAGTVGLLTRLALRALR